MCMEATAERSSATQTTHFMQQRVVGNTEQQLLRVPGCVCGAVAFGLILATVAAARAWNISGHTDVS